MRIGVNALYLIPGGVGGTEIYLRCLLAALRSCDMDNEYCVYTNRETGPDLVPEQSNFQNMPQPVRASNRPARICWEQTGLALQTARDRLDVLLNPGFTAPLLAVCPQVTVFHDLQHKRHPEYFRWFDLPFWRMLLYAAAHRSDVLIADSEATRMDLERYYRLPARRIQVVPLGVDTAFRGLVRRPTDPPYFLNVSTLHPHKNLDRLMRAFALFRRDRPDFRLVVAGLRGFFADQLEDLRRELGLHDAVEFTGWIPRVALLDLFSGATAFIYPSTFEGFGLPVVEALAAGVPAACSRIEPLTSIVAGAALQFDPQDVDSILCAMRSLATDSELAACLAARGIQRAAAFSWDASARLTLETLSAAASRS